MTLSIRQITAEDRDAWQRLWTAYLDFYESSVPAAVYESSFARLLSGDPHEYSGLIAEVDGEPVGLAHYLLHRDMWMVENTCYLMDLFVDPNQRGGGVGRALIEAVERAAARAGAASLYWHTQSFNTAARKLYDQLAELTPYVQYSKSLGGTDTQG